MDKILLFLSIIGILSILCQWYVISSIRSYLFQRYEQITRHVAYPILIFLGILNLTALLLAVDCPWLKPESFVRKAVAVTFFSYLAAILALCLFFLTLGIFSHVLNLGQKIKDILSKKGPDCESVSLGRIGCSAVRPSLPNRSDTDQNRGTDPPGCVDESSPFNEMTTDLKFTDTAKPLAPPISRRKFLKWSAAAGVATTLGFGADGVVQAYSTPSIEEFDLYHPHLGGLVAPLTLIHITDFHFGLFCGTGELDRLVRIVNSIEADAVVFTGDMFHSRLSPVECAIPVIRKLRPRRFGNFAVMGNHDFYTGELRSVQALQDGGLRLLRNEWITFQADGTDIHLGGIDDPMVNWVWGKEFPGFTRFLEGTPKSRGFRILLSHRPSILPLASSVGMDFVLAGHTHGGQIIFPAPGAARGFSLARMVSPYTHGWYSRDECRMYLNRGVGLTFIPWRINCPPEIAVIHLSGANGTNPISRHSDCAGPAVS